MALGCSCVRLLMTAVIVTLATAQNQIPAGCEGEADVVFLLDNSVDTTEEGFERSKMFARDLVANLDIAMNKTRVGVASIALNGTVDIFLSQFFEKGQLMLAMENIAYQGAQTDLGRVLEFVDRVMFNTAGGSRPRFPKVLFVIASDRLFTAGVNIQEPAQNLKNKATDIYAVTYGTDVVRPRLAGFLRQLVSDPMGPYVWMLDDANSLFFFRNDILTGLCRGIPACAGQADISFVLDSSGSVGYKNWGVIRDFCVRIINEMFISWDGVRISVVTFSDNATIEFYLDRHRSKGELTDAISKLAFLEGATNTSGALRALRRDVYEQRHGDRLNVRDIAIVISDGASTIQPELTATEANDLHENGIRVFAIGIGENVRTVDRLKNEMQTIGTNPDSEHVFHVSDFNNLREIESTLVRRTCREAPPICTDQVDIAFLIDSSGSINEDDFQRVLNFVRELAARLDYRNNRARVALMTFADTPKVEFFLDQYTTAPQVTGAIQRVEYTHGGTNTGQALRYARQVLFSETNGNRLNIPDVLFIITDGESTNPDETIDEARLLRDNGVTVLALGVGKWVHQSELEGMASHPKSRNVFNVLDYNSLFQALDLLVLAICNLENECRSSPCQNGGTCRDAINMYYCRCPSGFTGKDCDQRCPHIADIAIAMDASGSIEKPNFFIMQDFVRDLIYGLNIEGGTRVSIILYSTNANLRFGLDAYNTTKSVLNAMNFRYTGGTTNTAEALRLMRNQVFTQGNGDRPNAVNIGIILTDGKSNNRDDTLAEAVATRKAGIHLVAIGVGPSVGQKELKGIASDPDDQNVYKVRDFNALAGVLTPLIRESCNIVNECEGGPCLNGGVCIDGLNDYTCRCRAGFTGRHCQRFCTNRADIAFLIDSSGSIQKENYGHVIDFVKSLVRQLDLKNDQIHVSLISFNENAEVRLPFSTRSEAEDVLYALDKLGEAYVGGKTNTARGISLARNNLFTSTGGDRPDVANYVIVVTDGLPNTERENMIPEAINAKIEGIHVVLVSIGSGLNSGRNYLNLHGIASEPFAANIFNVEDFKDLDSVVPNVAGAVCNSINECESSPCLNRGTCIDGLKSYLCRCDDRFTGVNCERRCATQTDVAFLVDISGSLEGTFDIPVSFIKRVVSGLNFKFSRTRISFTTYAERPDTKFFLDTYSTDRDILNAITVSEVGFHTNIAAALRQVRDNVFNPGSGDRNGVDNVLVLLSDGKATMEKDFIDQVVDGLRRGRGRVRIYVIGLGDSIDREQLARIASAPESTHMYRARSREETDVIADVLLNELCT